MDAYHALAVSYDRLTNDVDYQAVAEFYMQILRQEGLKPRTAVDLACGTGSVALLLIHRHRQAREDALCIPHLPDRRSQTPL